jgi:hypothetical protein
MSSQNSRSHEWTTGAGCRTAAARALDTGVEFAVVRLPWGRYTWGTDEDAHILRKGAVMGRFRVVGDGLSTGVLR